MYIKVKVVSGARKEEIIKVSNDHYEMSLMERAVNNSANRRLLEIMHVEYPKTQIRIIIGHHSSSKIVSVDYCK